MFCRAADRRPSKTKLLINLSKANGRSMIKTDQQDDDPSGIPPKTALPLNPVKDEHAVSAESVKALAKRKSRKRKLV